MLSVLLCDEKPLFRNRYEDDSMAVKIRLRRTGKRNAPAHRIVVADSRSPRDGRFIESIGVYDPRRKFEQIDVERVDYWVGNGAQVSETVAAIVKRARAGIVRDGVRTTPDRKAEIPAVAPEEAPPEAEEEEAAEDDEAEADDE